VGAALVFIAHWCSEVGLQRVGDFGVEIFFVISGYVISKNSLPKSRFLKKRMSRIYIPFLMVFFPYAFLMYIFPGIINSQEGNAIDFIGSLFLLPFPIISEGLPLFSLSWTLIFEIYFYLLYWLLIGRTFAARIMLVSIAIMSAILFGGEYFSNPIWICFLAGVSINKINGAHFRISRNVIFNIILLISACFCFFLGLEDFDYQKLLDRPLIWVLGAALLVLAASNARRVPVSDSFLARVTSVSRLTYEFYLTHLFALGLVFRVLDQLDGHFLSLPLSITLSLLFSLGLHLASVSILRRLG